MTPYRVLLFASWYRHGLGFAGTELAIGLHEAGLNVTAVSGPGEDFPGLIERLYSKHVHLRVCPRLDDPMFKMGLSPAKCLAKIASDAGSGEVVIFHCLGLKQAIAANIARILIRRRRRSIVVVTVTSLRHGTWYERAAYIAGSRLYAILADRVIALCQEEATRLRRAGLPGGKIAIIHNWKDVDTFQSHACVPLPEEIEGELSISVAGSPLKPDWRRVVYAAAYEKRKGHRTLLKAIAILRSKGLDVNCICVGNGEERRGLQECAVELDVADRTCLGPRVHNGLIPSLLRRADVVVVASQAETFGVAIIEPLIIRVPVVSTRVGCALELETEGAIHAVRVGDAQGLASGIEWVLTNQHAARAAAERGGRWVRTNCDLRPVADRLRTLYELVIERGSPSQPH